MNDNIKHITQEDLVKIISYNTPHTKKTIREVLDGLEDFIIKEALLTTPESSLKIKLFKGFYLMVKYSDGKGFIKGATKGNEIKPYPKFKLQLSDTFKNKMKKMYN